MTVVVRLALDTLVLPAAPVALAGATARVLPSPAARRALGAIAATLGIAIAHVVCVGVPRWPPLDTIGWIPFAVVLAAIAIAVDGRLAPRLAIAFALAAIAVRLVGRPVWHSVMDAAPWAALGGGIAAAIDASHAFACRRMPPAAALIALALAMAGGAFACLFGHSALLAQVLGASAAVIGAAGLVAIAVEPARAIASIAAVAAVASLAYARLYATLPARVAGLLLAAAAAPLVASALPLSRRARGCAASALAIALGAAAAWCAHA